MVCHRLLYFHETPFRLTLCCIRMGRFPRLDCTPRPDLSHPHVLNTKNTKITDEISRCPALGVIYSLSGGNTIGCTPIRKYGTEEQKVKYLPRVHGGDIRFCLAITEPGGSYTLYIEGGRWLLTLQNHSRLRRSQYLNHRNLRSRVAITLLHLRSEEMDHDRPLG